MIPYTFGINSLAFEGNVATFELYNTMKNKKKDFRKALGFGILIVTILYQMLGTIVYFTFAQFT